MEFAFKRMPCSSFLNYCLFPPGQHAFYLSTYIDLLVSPQYCCTIPTKSRGSRNDQFKIQQWNTDHLQGGKQECVRAAYDPDVA